MKKQYGCIVPVSMLALSLLILGLFLFPQLAQAQSQRNPCYYTTTGVTSCQPVGTSVTGAANGPLPVGGIASATAPTFVEGKVGGLSFDLSGNLRTASSGGGGGSVTQGTVPWVVSGQGTAGTAATGVVTVQGIAGMMPVLTSTSPSSSALIGISPTVSAAGESSHVLKAGAGNVYSAYAVNLTATQGFFVLLNATSAPVDGAVTPLACAPLAPNGIASLNYAPGPPGVFGTGITAVVTSANTCFTKTTGVITAFISGSVQ